MDGVSFPFLGWIIYLQQIGKQEINPKIFKDTEGTNQRVYKRCVQFAIRKEKLWLFIAGPSLHKAFKITESMILFEVLYSSKEILGS